MSTMTPVSVPDSETSALFNPAFCAVLLNRASFAYEAKAGTAMPVTFAFLILPSALHKPTRDALPRTTSSSMWSWLKDNPLLLIDFADRVRTFRPITSTAITFALQYSVLKGSSGAMGPGTLKRRPRNLYPSDDWTACVTAAEFLGRWFGASETDEATTLAQWGVRP